VGYSNADNIETYQYHKNKIQYQTGNTRLTGSQLENNDKKNRQMKLGRQIYKVKVIIHFDLTEKIP
jgi:hypothetical protein